MKNYVAEMRFRLGSSHSPENRCFQLATLALVLLATSSLTAQGAPPNPDLGVQMWSTNNFGINLATSAININIPMRSKIGAIPFTSSLFATSQAYISTSSGEAVFYATTPFNITLPYDVELSFTRTVTDCPGSQKNNVYTYTNLGIIDSSGVIHTLPGNITWALSTVSSCQSTPGPAVTTDGSGYSVVFNVSGVFTIYSPSGQYWGGTCLLSGPTCGYNQSVTDPDGNTIFFNGTTGVTDTLNTTALSWTTPGFSYFYVDVLGNNQYFNGTLTAQPTKTNFGCEYVVDQTGNSALLSSLTVPGSGQYSFTYEPTPGYDGTYVTGRIATITFPSGGSIQYSYSGGNNGFDCTTGVVPEVTVSLIENNATMGTYTYVNNNSSSGESNYTVVRTDPAGNQTLYNFAGQFQTQAMFYQGGCPTSSQDGGCSGGGTLLKTVTTCYNGNLTSCATVTNVTPQIQQTDVYTSLGTSSPNLVETIYDCKATPKACYGNIVQVSSYDFTGTLLQQTSLSYGQSWNTTSKTCNPYPAGTYINNTPCYIDTQSAGTDVANTQITYSNTGHPLTVVRATSASGSPITTSAQYNTNGTMEWVQDERGTTRFTYAATSSGGCNSVLLTSVSYPVDSLSTSQTWDCNGGVLVSSTDANQQVTNYGYTNESGIADPLWRRLSVQDPLQNTTWTDYSPGTTLPETVETYLNFNSGASTVDTLNTLDGFGRLIQTQKRTAPKPASTFDQTVSYTYGFGLAGAGGCSPTGTTTGACMTQTVPGGTALTTTQFDALGRTVTVKDGGGGTLTSIYSQNDIQNTLGPAPAGEHTKSRQAQYDGLGRVTSACEILSTGGSNCGQNATASGYLTSYQYSTPSAGGSQTNVTQGSQGRQYIYDELGRLISETNPESGTTTYTYDTVAGNYCAVTTSYTSYGDLVAVGYANGYHVCYWYDAMHRLTDVGNNAQSTVNACKRFRYDSANNGYVTNPPSGYPGSGGFLAGRLVEVETDAGSMVTDEWFSYDQDGNVTDMWEMTPHSGQYYHATTGTAGIQPNGAVTSLQLASPSLYTMTYGLDGEGRRDTLNEGSTQVVTCSTTPCTTMYDPSGRVVNVQLTGSTPDQDIFTYDQSTGRMATFEFEVGNTPANLTGTLTWNQNGTLGKVQIADGFNSGGTQTCYSNYQSALGYGYDDLGRLAVFDCGSNMGEEFTYDQYGNLTQNPLPNDYGFTWAPGYSPTTNYVSGATYDASGNMTNDGGTNVYGWNVYGKLAWTATSGTPTCGTSGKCITYDAFGRIVEESSGSAWREIWYTQVPGSTVNMSGTTANYAYWPSPGRGTFVASGSDEFLHQDWLGNDRIVSSTSGHSVTADRAYAPFGEQYNTIGSANPIYGIFAGMTGDYDSGILFETPNREFAGYQGRWVSPDPAGLAAVDQTNPQTWNRYAYVTNNPLALTDPSGLFQGIGGPSACDIGDCGTDDPCAYGFCNNLCDYADCGEDCYWLGCALDFPNENNVPKPGSVYSNQIFPGEDCVGCWQIGPSVTQILGAVLSGNLYGALQSMGAVPDTGINCTYGLCQVNPIMDAQTNSQGYWVGDYSGEPGGCMFGVGAQLLCTMWDPVTQQWVRDLASESAQQLAQYLDVPFMDVCDLSGAVESGMDTVDTYTPIDIPKERWINRGLKLYNYAWGCK
jgi:RHS repeat-associated protein